MSKGRLFVISGPSGAGKSTITKKIISLKDNLFLSTSVTTRKPRIGEIDGKDYYFYTKEKFIENIEKNNFIEYAKVHNNYYGTLKSEISEKLEMGKNIILEIDVQGGEQIKKQCSDAVLIFVKAPNKDELEKRLRSRNTDTEEVIELRLKNSLKELEYEKFYNEILINITIEDSLDKLSQIIDKYVIGGDIS